MPVCEWCLGNNGYLKCNWCRKHKYTQTPIYSHPHVAPMKSPQPQLLIVQYFDVSPPSIHHHKLRSANSDVILGSVLTFWDETQNCYMYINQQDAQISAIKLYFLIRFSYMFREQPFISCTSHLVYSDTSGCCVAMGRTNTVRNMQSI